MRDRVVAFESAKDDKEEGLQTQSRGRGGLGATLREGLKAGKQLNVLMKKLYKDAPDKLAAWTTAFHTERVGKSGKAKKKPEPPPAK